MVTLGFIVEVLSRNHKIAERSIRVLDTGMIIDGVGKTEQISQLSGKDTRWVLFFGGEVVNTPSPLACL
jgi:hypothetical protein